MSAKASKEVDRVEKNKGRKLAFGLAVMAILISVLMGISDALTFWGIVGAATLVGYVIGRTIKQRWCSGCDERLTDDDATCPGCKGTIRGNVAG